MSKSKFSAAKVVRRWLGAGCIALLSAAAIAAPDPSAAPAAAADAVARLPADPGLDNSASTDSAFVERLRDRASDMVLIAMNFLGVPYRRGGTTADRGFDCSGFTRHVFETSVGKVLPRRADEQAKTAGLLSITRTELKPGDLVFFNTVRRTFSHVGIYVGNGKFIHAPRTGGEVRVENIGATYWSKRFTGARRADLGVDAEPVESVGVKPPSARTIY